MVALGAVVVVAPALRFGVPWVSRLLTARDHLKQYIAARNRYQAARDTAPPGPWDMTSHWAELQEHIDALVQLRYWQHRVVPLECSYPPGAFSALFQDLASHTDFDLGAFNVQLLEPGVEIWGIPKQVRTLEDVVRQHEQKQAAEPARPTDAAMPNEGEGREE